MQISGIISSDFLSPFRWLPVVILKRCDGSAFTLTQKLTFLSIFGYIWLDIKFRWIFLVLTADYFHMQVRQLAKKSGPGIWKEQRKIWILKGTDKNNLICMEKHQWMKVLLVFMLKISYSNSFCFSGALKLLKTWGLFHQALGSSTKWTWSTWQEWWWIRMATTIQTVWWALTRTPPW